MNQTKPNDAKNNAAPTDAVNYSAPPKTLGEAISTCFFKYSDSKGRASRSEFWWFLLFAIFCFVAMWLLSFALALGLISESFSRMEEGSWVWIVYLPVFLPAVAMVGFAWFWVFLSPLVAVNVRRFHDIGYSGWWHLGLMVLCLIPWLGLLSIIAWLILPALPPVTGKTKYDT